MKAFTFIICCSSLLTAVGGATAGQMIIQEFPDRFVVEYDGTNDPKLPPVKKTPQELALEEAMTLNEERNSTVRNRVEERMERVKSRIEENQRALEKKRKEQEGTVKVSY